MRTFQRFLSVFTILAVMSGPGLMAAAQADQNQDQYDSSADNQPVPEANEAPEPQYDQPQASTNDQPESNQPAVDPPARAARLQYMTGSVSVQPQGTGEWVTGELNRPLTNSDNIWADKNSKAEINAGTGLIRIGSETSLTLTNVDDSTVQLQLHQGALNLHVRRLYDNERYEVDTPNQAFTVLKPGDYRFDVNPDADKTVITVWRGEGDSTGDGPSVHIHANEQARFSNGTSMTVDIHTAPAADSFDEWASSRDQRLDNSASARHVSPDVVGYEDLDEYGSWKDTEEYGSVWYPSVAPGWAPYYDGHWIWENPWGWTWVEYEPWGYAPFHYGRWVYAGGFWGWAPGPVYVRPYYAPALVAWFGGGGWGVGVGFGGGFGWCPLGWGEPFIPWYGVSRGYFNRVNITNTHITNINITNIYNNHFVNGRFNSRTNYRINYANMRVRGGFTAASRNTLVNSLSVARNGVRVAPNQLGRVTPVHSLGIAPTRTSMLGSRGTRAAVPPQRAFSRPVVSRLAAPNRGGLNAGARAGFNGQAGVNGRGSFNGRAGVDARAGVNQSQAGIRGNVARPGQAGAGTLGGTNRGPAMNNSRPMPNASSNARPMPHNGSRPMPNAANSSRPMPSMQNNSRPMPNAGGRSVPRPPTATGSFGGRETFGSRGMNAGPNNGRINSAPQIAERGNVPRPPSAGMGRGEPSYSQRGASPSYSPRPAGPSSSPRGESPSYSPRGGSAPSYSPRGGSPTPQGGAPRGSGPRASANVPRPSPGFVASNRTNESFGRPSQSYSRPSESYGRSPSYGGSNSRPAPSYDRGSYSRSVPSYGRSTPAYGGSYGRASAAPSYGGGGYSRSMPSYGGGSGRSMPSYGGGHAAPSYSGGGFGGGRSSGGFGGGGHASYGGGGGGGAHAASGGGGGHSGGGGHGGHR